MSKPARKHRPVKKLHKPHHEPKPNRTNEWLKKHLVVILTLVTFAGIPFALGKYFEFGSPDPWDSSSYVYSAKHVLDGAEIGVEENPSAHIGTLLVNMLGVALFGYSETGPTFIQMMLQLAALAMMFVALRRLYGVLAAVISVVIASVYLSAPVISQGGNVKEQYMIACMIIGISCYVLQQIGGKWWYAILAGAFLSWAPLFKPTGISALGGIGLFVIVQPFLRNRTWKQTGSDILLLFTGALVAIVPLYVWIWGWNVKLSPPYYFLWESFVKYLPFGSKADPAEVAADYIVYSRKLVPFSRQYPMVLRFYRVLMLPITLALVAIVMRVVFLIRPKLPGREIQDRMMHRFVLLFAGWWILDMALVWVSPRSYKQYYLPLNASAAMLGAYFIDVYAHKFRTAQNKTRWVIIGLIGLLVMIGMSWHIFFGLRRNPFGGGKVPKPVNGYAQKWDEIGYYRKHGRSWEATGDYIRLHSEPTDTMYVWGWFPGIYVRAERFSAAAKACFIPRTTPDKLEEITADLIEQFEQRKPKFIVDSRKRHIPTNRPPYELWPIWEFNDKIVRFLPLDQRSVENYGQMYERFLRETYDEEEAKRYKVIAPLRKYIRENYKVVEQQRYRAVRSALGLPTLIHESFGIHVVFVRK
jgi:hypothetical protein